MLDRITPLLITLDEEPNIERTLAALAWAREIVVVDSGSTDGTLELLRLDPRVRVVTREFDTFAGQLGFGLNAGHDLNLDNIPAFQAAMPPIAEMSIGHAITADALKMGFTQAVVAYLGAMGSGEKIDKN